MELRELGLEDATQAGHEVVRLSELRDAFPLPHVPCGFGRVGHGAGVAFQHGHIVTVTREQERRPEAADACTEDESVRH